MLNFCTLFDSNYISRGLSLFDSLKKNVPEFHLFVVAFDDESYRFLNNLPDQNLTAISLTDFEDDALKQVKSGRSAAEYCWTCTPSVILFCIEKFNLPSCTYLDADMIFYENPQLLFDELADDSVIITDHRYTRDYDVSATHGIYCVQFMFFKNDENGMTALRWWRARCLEWCFARLEDGKFGDQKYLDDWTTRFPGVHVLKHQGGGLAPWNVQQYSLESINGKIFITAKKGHTKLPLVFFHFHGLKFYSDEKVACCDSLYELESSVKEILYFPYIQNLLDQGNRITGSGFRTNPQGARTPSPSVLKTIWQYGKNVVFLVLKRQLPVFKIEIYNPRLHDHIYKLSSIK